MRSFRSSSLSRVALGMLAVTLGSAAPAGTFRPEPYPSWEETGVSQKLNLFTFYEEHEGLSVFAGTEVMRFHDEYTFFPMQIAVGNNNPKPVVLTPEEFVLTDDQGVYYPLATQTDIGAEYTKSAFDRNLVANADFLANKFRGFRQIPSLFYPNIAVTGVLNQRIELPQTSYLSDVLYFRKPVGSLQGRTFTLTVYFPQQERQLDVKFALPAQGKNR